MMNQALRPMSREAFIDDITKDVPETPVDFLHSRDMNQAGPALREGAEMPPLLAPEAFAAAAREGAVILDARDDETYAAAHPLGALHVGLDGQYASWVGTLVDPADRVLLVCEPDRNEEAVMRLARVGYDNVVGILDGGIEGWKSAGLPVAKLAMERADRAFLPGRPVLDVRRSGEWEDFHLKGATHVPLSQLPTKLGELDHDADWVLVCAGGYRSIIAASVLERAGFTRLTNAVGGMDFYQQKGLPVETGA
jgi:rhodanese-related sulfurtransferase